MSIEKPEMMRFQPQRPVGVRPYWQFAGGLSALLIALAVFLSHLFVPPEKQTPFPIFIGTCVVLTLIAISAIGNAIWLLRSPNRVELWPEGMVIVLPLSCKKILWTEIGKIETDKREWPMMGQETRLLVLYGTLGGKLATITDRIAEFDGLVTAVQARVAPAADKPVADARLRRSKPVAAGFFVFGILMTAATIFIGVEGWRTKTNLELMQSEGREIQAAVVKHYIYNVTPRIEYSFTAADGSKYTRNTEMTRAAWDLSQNRETVDVRYVPSNPDFSRLVEGEGDPTFDNWKFSLGLSVGGIFMSILIFAGAALRWTGRDITLDPATRKFRVMKFGSQDKK
jgi:hypothetical protein